MAELQPYPFAALVSRMFGELDRNQAIFDLPRRKFFLGDPSRDLSVQFHGRRASSPLGPAAGPQTQMAQNIVLSWLGGSRIMELKTVQVMDELEIPRPCIDMQTIGFNAEWSQELRLEQSLDEYVKGSMLVEMLQASGKLKVAEGFGDVLYDLSVGYDIAGIRSEKVQAFIRGMMEAKTTIETFRAQIPSKFKKFRDLDFAGRLADTVTLSTFHGCPPGEIENIIDFLMREFGLNCVVKFNPMLLGEEETNRLLRDRMGYEEIKVPPTAFERDATWDQAVEIMDRLGKTAAELGLSLGAKFSNTLIVKNERGFLPSSEEEVYLSGPPLHVLAMNLVQRFRETFGHRFPISFAAGIDRGNFADTAALGLVPITVCSDLLKPQGYGRLQGYYRDLQTRMKGTGSGSLSDFIIRAFDCGETALSRIGLPDDDPRLVSCQNALKNKTDLNEAAGEELFTRWVAESALLNTERYVAGLICDPRYTKERNAKPPKKIGSMLELFDCVSCDKCIPVCPNDANFTFTPARPEIPTAMIRRSGGRWEWRRGESIKLAENHQIGNFADFCNECGNCDIFCPEDGGPYMVKPRFFGSEKTFKELAPLDGFLISNKNGGDLVLARFQGQEFQMELTGGRVAYSGPNFHIHFEAAKIEETLDGDGPAEIDLTYYYIMDCIREGILNPVRVNFINTLYTMESTSS